MYIIFPRLLCTHCYMVATRPGLKFARFALFRAPHSWHFARTPCARQQPCVWHRPRQGCPAFLSQGPQPSLWDGSGVARGKTAISGTPDHLNECVFAVHVYGLEMWPWVTLTQPDGSRVGHLWVKVMLSLCTSWRRVEWRYRASSS